MDIVTEVINRAEHALAQSLGAGARESGGAVGGAGRGRCGVGAKTTISLSETRIHSWVARFASTRRNADVGDAAPRSTPHL
jgi:hypothetical protein